MPEALPTPPRSGPKVFWFFFSKKNALLAFYLSGRGGEKMDGFARARHDVAGSTPCFWGVRVWRS
jgi:hypothetical protein